MNPAKNRRLIVSVDREEVFALRSIDLAIGYPRFASPLHLHSASDTYADNPVQSCSKGVEVLQRILQLGNPVAQARIEVISIAKALKIYVLGLAVNFHSLRYIEVGNRTQKTDDSDCLQLNAVFCYFWRQAAHFKIFASSSLRQGQKHTWLIKPQRRGC